MTPSFQQGPFLEQTILSVLAQEDVTIDYVIQDGGSSDESVSIIRRYESRLAHWESKADAGQAAAIIRGFSHSRSSADDLMMYLNSDDLLLPGAARFAAEYFAAHLDVDVVYGCRVLIDEHGREVGRCWTPRDTCLGLSMHDYIPQETLMWRRRIWDRVGGIDSSFKFALDWDLLLRFQAAGARFARLPWFLGGFRLHARQKTQTQLHDEGHREMMALRRRTLGREPTQDEMHLAWARAEVDSAMVFAQHKRGRRV